MSWAGAGLLVYGVSQLGRDLLGAELSWGVPGAGWLVVVAVDELTPLKDACLANAEARSASCSAAGATGCRAR